MTSVDRLGFHVRLKTRGWHARSGRSAFLREVQNSAETREVFIEMVRQARQGTRQLALASASKSLLLLTWIRCVLSATCRTSLQS